MKDIIVLGAGGLGREIWCYLEQKTEIDKDFAQTYRLKGFVDDNLHALDDYCYPSKIVGTVADYEPCPNELLVCAIADSEAKARLCPALKSRGAAFLTFVHPSAIVASTAVLGEGVVIAPYTHVSADVRLGDFAFLNCRVTCGHDVRVGAYSTVSSYCDLTGFVELGERCFMGSHASIIPQRRVGDGVRIGAGSIVLNSIPNNRRVFGVPAKPFMRG